MELEKPKIILYFVVSPAGSYQIYIKFIFIPNPRQTYDVFILDKGREYPTLDKAKNYADKYIQSLSRKIKKEYDVSIDEEIQLKYPSQVKNN